MCGESAVGNSTMPFGLPDESAVGDNTMITWIVVKEVSSFGVYKRMTVGAECALCLWPPALKVPAGL
jgi:hypothetical protein